MKQPFETQPLVRRALGYRRVSGVIFGWERRIRIFRDFVLRESIGKDSETRAIIQKIRELVCD